MLVCIGEILVDIFRDGSFESIMIGGAPFNVAANATAYSKDVYFIGSVGNDNNGHFLISEAKKYDFKNLDIKIREDKETSRAIVTLINGERYFRFERDDGADYLFNISDIDYSLFKERDIIHIGSLMLSYPIGREFYFEFIKRIKEIKNIKISFDINYRDDIFSSSNEAKNIFKKALKQADILKFSEDELLFLSDENDILKAINKLAISSKMIVITLGKNGSIFYDQNKLIHVPSYPIEPVDTTGAGDAFYSYFLTSLINHPDFIFSEEEIKKYLLRANAAGALVTTKKGALNTLIKEEDIDNFIKKNQ